MTFYFPLINSFLSNYTTGTPLVISMTVTPAPDLVRTVPADAITPVLQFHLKILIIDSSLFT